MKTFSNFIVEIAGDKFAAMSDADFERWVKAHPDLEKKAREVRATAKRRTYTSSGSAGQGVRDAQQTARNARQTGGSTPPSTPKPGAAPKPGVGGLRNAVGRFGGPAVSGYFAYDDYKDRRNQGQSQVQAAGAPLSSWASSALASKSAAKTLSPLLAAPFPGARPLYGLGVLGAGMLGYYGGGKGFDTFYNKAKGFKPPQVPTYGGAGGLGTMGDALGSRDVKPKRTMGGLPADYKKTELEAGRNAEKYRTGAGLPQSGGGNQGNYGTAAPTPPKPKPQKSARQKELDAINADKTLTPIEKWEKANPNLATAQKEKERIRGTAQSDNPLLDKFKLRSGMRAGSPTVQDPKVQQLGKGYQRLANNPNAGRAANPSLLSRSMQSSRPTSARNNARPLSLNVA
tara:strand:+ start:60 stop:1259 length:1200 start_codon:yes stop_codon:yes gene_type:complete